MARATRGPKKTKTLTEELATLLEKTFVPDLTERARQPKVEAAVRNRYDAEKARSRTAASFAEWVDHAVEQVGAAWILSCVFVRTLEDRGFLERRRLAGEGALDSQEQFFKIAPSLTERDYLLTVFRELATYPGIADVLGPVHNPAWWLSPSNDSVRAMLSLFHEVGEHGLRFEFTGSDTRFLGDLYQDLSQGARKRYALLQTPDFVERFILDQTLEPAIQEFGLEAVRVIDPTCGSGHFLLGAFHRLFEHRMHARPDVDRREHAARALMQVYGVDVNPYAAAIARFRLTLAYLQHAGITKLSQAPRIEANLVVADSLLHGGTQRRLAEAAPDADKALWRGQMFMLEDALGGKHVFSQRYHAVVGNPPYITCKDAALREVYRERYESAAGKYALAAPFTERFFQLAEDSGFIGLINANSFMKREFGKALIEKALKRVDLTAVIDSSGAFIPGHTTPTVLLFGRNRAPLSNKVRVVMSKHGEPSTPDIPENGQVWTSITGNHAEVDFENEFISVANVLRETLNSHPWSLGGGGASDLKELLEERCERRLDDVAEAMGIAAVTGEDDIYLLSFDAASRAGIEHTRPMVLGEDIRDWTCLPTLCAVFPYDDQFNLLPIDTLPATRRWLSCVRAVISKRKRFGRPMLERGLAWYELQELYDDKLRSPLSIVYAEVSTHNHFVLDRGGKVFKQTAPIIKLVANATEDDHLALLGYLNSSTACFWMKQVCFPKGTSTKDINKKRGEPEDNRYAFSSTAVSALPLPPWKPGQRDKGISLTRQIMQTAEDRESRLSPRSVINRVALGEHFLTALVEVDRERQRLQQQLVELQNALDDLAYAAFELSGSAQEPESEIGLIEQPVYKRRWSGRRGIFGHGVMSFEESVLLEARAWIQERVEQVLAQHQRPTNVSTVLQQVAQDVAVKQVMEQVLRIDASGMIAESWDMVPFLAAHRLEKSGLEKLKSWMDVWERQHAGVDDGIDAPPKYVQDDYQAPMYWRLRGSLDVPRERFISYPGCERDEDKSPLIGWAGWNHLERAQALASLFQERKEQDGWEAERLMPILAGLLELVPWVKQWHNEPDPTYDGQRMGDVYEAFVSEKVRELRLTLDDLRNWRPQPKQPKTKKPKADSTSGDPVPPKRARRKKAPADDTAE